MKKFTIVLTLAAFSFLPALQADDGAGCCPASKPASSGCPMSKQTDAKCGGCAKTSGCAKNAGKTQAKIKFDTSAKGASILVKK